MDINQELVDLLKKSITIDESGHGKAPDLFEKSLADTGLTVDDVKKAQSAMTNFSLAASKAFGESAIPVLANNPKLKDCILEVPVGHDTATIRMDRERKLRSKENGPSSIPANVRYTVNTGDHYQDERKKMQEELSKMFLDAVAKNK